MRLVIYDRPLAKRINFAPLALSRPIFELRCGMTSLREKLIARFDAKDVAYFVPPYMAEVYRTSSGGVVNDLRSLTGDDLLLIDSRVKASELHLSATGPSQVGLDVDGEVLYVRLAREDSHRVATDSLENLLDSAVNAFPETTDPIATWNYTWDLVLANPSQLTLDIQGSGRSGIEGTIEEPRALRGSMKDVYVAPGAVVHPMVVIDAEHGPVYLDEGVEVHPFTRIEGPCYVGKKSILLGCKCREGNSIGPMCRVGGEVEESIIQGYSNKYHDGFLGHAYVGQWVNLGALTTNSDLKNDYTNVSVVLDGIRPINTGSTKIGSLIGDHTKTSIGVLMNTGAYVGAMCLIATNGKLLPKFMPCFSWFVEGTVTKGFGRKKIYETARIAMSRRQCVWTEAEEQMWEEIFHMTSPEREEAIKRGRNLLVPSPAA